MRFHLLAAPAVALLAGTAAQAMDEGTLAALDTCKSYVLEQPDYADVSAESVTVLPAESTGGTAIVNWHVELATVQSGTCTVSNGSVTEFSSAETEELPADETEG